MMSGKKYYTENERVEFSTSLNHSTHECAQVFADLVREDFSQQFQ
jgi:hypothetical protein